MRFLVILLLFGFVGKITSTPRVAYRIDDDSTESDEADVAADDEPYGEAYEHGESSEEVPDWSFREIPQESRWQQQPQGDFQESNKIQGNTNFQLHHELGGQQQRPYFNSPIRRFRDDDSDEEEDEEDDEDFNDDVVNSDISYSPPSSVGRGVSTGGFRAIAISGRGRATPTMTQRPGSVSSRPMSMYNGMRMPVYNRMPMYNRVQTSSSTRRPSYGGQQQYGNRYVSMNPYRRVPQRATMNYPVRRVTTSMAVVNRGQYQTQRPGMGMVYRPMVYDRQHMMPYRQSNPYGQSYNYNRQPMMTGNGGRRRV